MNFFILLQERKKKSQNFHFEVDEKMNSQQINHSLNQTEVVGAATWLKSINQPENNYGKMFPTEVCATIRFNFSV